ncbi:hypothetical protein ABZ467_25810 [Streptomyces sp. NPDC005727]
MSTPRMLMTSPGSRSVALVQVMAASERESFLDAGLQDSPSGGADTWAVR